MEIEIFRKFLSGRGLKLTNQRVAVFNEIFAFHGHFEPERLYLKIKDSGTRASRASVYRTLNLLVESGLVEKITRTEKGNVYEHTYGHRHHDHMVCEVCDEIIEFYSEKIENLQDEICRKNNFRGVSHTLEIRGYCEKCGRQR
ncbi:MAG: Fur family transcriptional regulator [Nitrospirota bacterium]|nr:Fur family transcriptional regulator [Nitrospirota bacterium]